MNAARNIVFTSLRGYRSIRGRRSAWETQLEAVETQSAQKDGINPDILRESYDPEDGEYDIDAFESDFSAIPEVHKMHERELDIEKKKLKTQIVKRKYFKTDEPATLTWGEKEQIRLLYEKNPEEWTPDKLSESFPASREAILKIVRSKWLPRSTKVIEQYERKVRNNWELFKAGKLDVDPKLHEHLSKFKNRKLEMMDEQTMMKFVKQKPVFPKPKSTMFSSIIQNYNDRINAKKKSAKLKENELQTEEISIQITSGMEDTEDPISFDKSQPDSSTNTSMTYDVFLKKHTESINPEFMTPVDRVIVNEYKKSKAESYKMDTLVLVSPSPLGTDNNRKPDLNKDKNTSVAKVTADTSKSAELSAIKESTVDTGIIAREKLQDAPKSYPNYIKIPRKYYKPGATYRVEDRYYHDDGEFLYRVPMVPS